MLELFDYWCRRRSGKKIPSRRDIEPTEISRLLSRIFLVDYEGAATFRYRLAGTEVAETYGYANLKGLTLADILSSDMLELVTHRWLRLVEERAVICMKGPVFNSEDRIYFGERIILPLAEKPCGAVTGLIGMTHAKWKKRPRNRIPAVSKTPHSEMAVCPVAEIA